jgi:lambda repressor-like predicted transcriptional regulator
MSDTLTSADVAGLALDGLSLNDLAEIANVEHGQAHQAFSSALTHAFLAGEALIAARQLLPPKASWQDWLDENLSFHRVTAAKYIRVATYRPEIEAHQARTGEPLNLPEAKALLVGKPSRIEKRLPLQHPPELRAEVRALRKDGWSIQDIADQVGVNYKTVNCWINPEYEKKQRSAREAHRTRQIAAKKALAEKERRGERDRLAKASKGAASDAYSLIRRCLASLDKALGESVDAEEREALRAALAAAHSSEDRIVEALKCSYVNKET